jgi:FAD/FMN-containing dehydrogenase
MARRSVFLLPIYTYMVVGFCLDHDRRITALNASVNGMLKIAWPIAAPCFSSFEGSSQPVDEEACLAVRENYTTNAFRAQQAAAFMNNQNEMCLSDPADQCILDNTVTPAGLAPSNATCRRGNVPDYYVEVTSAQDIISALSFSNTYGFPLSIKNSGHDYMTRSGAKAVKGLSSIELWVHNLKGLEYHDNYVPEGCGDGEGIGRAITVAAGESTGAAYEFANAHNATILGGYSPTIALSGGWVQGGGHSPLSPVYGLGVDRVVEFRLVTPDGVARVANACRNPDLFRALRGGGGGTFGVVLEATHRVEPRLPIAVASVTIPSNSTDDTVLEWIKLEASESYAWGRQGWGGHVAGLYVRHFNPVPRYANLSDGGAAAQATMQRLTDFALAHGGTSIVEVVPDWLTAWNTYVVPGALNSAGQARFITSRLIPTEALSTDAGVQDLLGLIDYAFSLGAQPRNFYVPVSTPFVAEDAPVERTGSSGVYDVGTSVTPAWYSSIWSLSSGWSLGWNSTATQRLESFVNLTKITNRAEELYPDSGTYLNEANPFTSDWKTAWWGDNYQFLLETKNRYDPNNTLKCWKCVGWDEQPATSTPPGYDFKCLGGLQDQIDQTLSGD